MKKPKGAPVKAKGPAKQAPPTKPPVSFLKGGITVLLTFLSILIIFTFFNLGSNSVWYNDRILKYWNDYNDQSDSLSIERRKIYTLGTSYTVSEGIAQQIARTVPPNMQDRVLILMPSQKYFRDRRINYHVPLPVVFYYYTGVKTIWANSKDATKANFCFRVEKGNCVLEKITDTTRLRTLITQFNIDTYEL